MNSLRRSFRLLLLCLAMVVVFLLLPWWRNHHYLRDLYDYGLVLAANGHFERGQMPYVDFTTPIQAGFLWLNWMIERWFGGSYSALTMGAAGLIAAAGITLPLMLSRRWSWCWALVVGGAVTAATASQHTILWHNSLGVVCLAVVSWASACAPVWRRRSWPWHLLVAGGLALGGVNKINFQLVALAAAMGWAIRAAVIGRATWRRTGGTMLGLILVGVILPVAGEMFLTGASLHLWLANVIELPAAQRLDILTTIGSPGFFLRDTHNYYGALLLPQIGLIGVVFTGGALVGCWPRSSEAEGVQRWDRVLVPLACVLAGLAGAALVATNYEISYIGLGAWVALTVSLWLGFGGRVRKWHFALGLGIPALVVGVASWWSAWLGQRSQFGYSLAPRSEYRPVTEAGNPFAHLVGLRMPPEVVESLAVFHYFLPEPDDSGQRRVFYGMGTEWLDRYFPAHRQKGEPLWVHWGTSYDAKAIGRLTQRLARAGEFDAVFSTIARNDWPAAINVLLKEKYVHENVGPILRRWTWVNPDYVDLTDGFATLAGIGGNVVGQVLHLERWPFTFRKGLDGKTVMGTTRRIGQIVLEVPSYRVQGTAILERMPGADKVPLRAEFKIMVHGAIPENVRWSTQLDLPAGQNEVSVPFQVDAEGKPLIIWARLSDGTAEHKVFAGYRDIEITHAIETDAGPPVLRAGLQASITVTPELAHSLFGAISWRPHELVMRGGRATARGLELPPGGEVWLHTDGMVGEMSGLISRVAGNKGAPSVRVVWYKGGRLQVVQNGSLQEQGDFDFHVWTAEPGGWMGILVDPAQQADSAVVRVTSATLTP